MILNRLVVYFEKLMYVVCFKVLTTVHFLTVTDTLLLSERIVPQNVGGFLFCCSVDAFTNVHNDFNGHRCLTVFPSFHIGRCN